MFSDFHTHTQFSGDCHTPAEAQIQQAIRLGMKELCITDHHDYDTSFATIDFTLDIVSYFSHMRQLQLMYQDQIRVNIGIELGLQLHIKEYLEGLTQAYPFDFIIGSSHFVDNMDPFDSEFFAGRTERAAYERFFQSTFNRVNDISCFDVLGHLDYVVRYGPNTNKEYSYSAYSDYIDPILKTLIQNGKGLECNTGGYHYQLGHPNPCEDILTRYKELGGEILTIGSDSHVPQNIGHRFHSLKSNLESCGFRYYTVFHQRKPEFIPL